MNKRNRKGFTITELVIVIAVIAILAAVLIPTFSAIVKKAQDSSDLQTARNILIEFIAENDAQVATSEYYIAVDDTYFTVNNNKLDTESATTTAPASGMYVVSKTGDTITAVKQS